MDNDGPTIDLPAMRSVVVVVIDLTNHMSLSAAEWTLDNHVKRGDLLIVLGVIEGVRDHPRQRLGFVKDDENVFKDANRKGMPDEAMRKKSELEKNCASLHTNCNKKGVMLEVRVKLGIVVSVVINEAIALHAKSVTFDRNLKLKKGKKMKLIDNLSCKIYQMKSDSEADMIHEGGQHLDAGGGFLEGHLTDESPEASLDRDSDCFSTNFEGSSSRAASNIGGLMDGQQSVSLSELYSTPGFPPNMSSPSDLSSWNSPMCMSNKSASSQSLRSGNAFSLPGESFVLRTCVSPPKNYITSLSRSASDTCFQQGDKHLETEKVSPDPGQLETSRPEESGTLDNVRVHNFSYAMMQSSANNYFGGFDIPNKFVNKYWLAKNYEMNQREQMKNSKARSLQAEDLECQQQTDSQKDHEQKPSEAPFQQIDMEKPISLNWSLLSKNFPDGRSFLCSVCGQKSPKLGNLPRRFSYAELETATGGFSKTNFLAEGGFGLVYKGKFHEQKIAVKQHKLASTQGYKEFRSEVEVLSCAQHRNLVMLLGCCDENGHRMLVYEYVCNKSLDWHLSDKSPHLEWASRQKIAIGAARALRYLHEECRVGCIVHRDMRPNNILLTHEFEPMVGDFGLARSHPEGEAIETRIIGTFGYLAPEYAESGQVSWRADVYAFGVVLLELITGRKAIDLSRPPGQQGLIEWARQRLVEDAMGDLVDKSLGESYNVSEMCSMMRAAHHCIKKDPSARPRMSQVLHILEGEYKDLDGIPRLLMDLSASATTKVSEFHASNTQLGLTPQTAPLQKSKSQKPQPGHSNRRKPKLFYAKMLS